MSGTPQYDPQFVVPLEHAKKDFLEVLLHEFELRTHGDGIRLVVSFDANTPAIGSSEGRRHVRTRTFGFAAQAAVHRAALDRFRAERPKVFSFNDPRFPFRYVSGGVLPVVEVQGVDHYCLIYRECFPVGWNLANGASDNLRELLDPFITVGRELREELIIVDPTHKRRFVFAGDGDASIDTHEADTALALWRERFAASTESSLDSFIDVPLAVEWIDGPDTVEATAAGEGPNVTSGCFLNINPEDGGIEVDRIARFSLDESTVLCDGELTGARLIDSVIGLFEVKRFNRALEEGSTEFVPDRFFYGGAAHSSTTLPPLDGILREDFVPRMQSYIPTWDRREWDDAAYKLDLCPATRTLAKRAAAR